MKVSIGFWLALAALTSGAALSKPVADDQGTVETIVLVRHGEKPALGLGQLDCQGLNRALALPSVIKREFGRPDAIFAPNAGQTNTDHGRRYNYIRPLATIEPTAIAFGLPIDDSIGLTDIDALRRKLDDPAYRSARIVVAWEHTRIVRLARLLLANHGGDPIVVPNWKKTDFDGIYVVEITRTGARTSATFERRSEGLNGEPTTCPGRP